MSRELKDQIRRRAEQSEFRDRLLQIASQIERDFDGRQRERLLAMVHETLERHLEIRENTRLARESLDRLIADHQRLLQLIAFIAVKPESETLH